MSYLLFLDERGHGHRTMPYEVRGGVAAARELEGSGGGEGAIHGKLPRGTAG